MCSNQRPQKKTEPTYWGLVARENGALEVSAVVCRLFPEPLWPVQGGRAGKPGILLRRFFESCVRCTRNMCSSSSDNSDDDDYDDDNHEHLLSASSQDESLVPHCGN